MAPAALPPLPPFNVSSEDPPQSRLQLPRVAESGPDRPVEVQERPHTRILEVIRVRDVEDLDQGLELPPRTGRERPGDPDIPGEVGVVLPKRVPQNDAAVRTDAVGRAGCAASGRRREGVVGETRPAACRRWLGRVIADPVV